MKNIIFTILITCSACSSYNNSNRLIGIYTTQFEHEYGLNVDTFIVEKINDNDIFQISRHTGLIKKFKEKKFPKELKIETWVLQYDKSKHTLTDLAGEKIIVWDNHKSALLLGNKVYKRVSP